MEETELRQANNGITGLFILWIITAIAFLVVTGILVQKPDFNKGYKQGQIDALNGIQHYDKLVKKDTVYIKIK